MSLVGGGGRPHPSPPPEGDGIYWLLGEGMYCVGVWDLLVLGALGLEARGGDVWRVAWVGGLYYSGAQDVLAVG